MTGMAHEAPRAARSSAESRRMGRPGRHGRNLGDLQRLRRVTHGSMNLSADRPPVRHRPRLRRRAACRTVVAEHDGGRFLQGVTFAVMLGAMTLSIGAIAAVVEPGSGPWRRGCSVSSSTLPRSSPCASSSPAGSGRRRRPRRWKPQSGPRRKRKPSGRRRPGAWPRPQERTALLEAELAAAKAALEAERERRVPARKQRRSSARKPATAATRNRAPGTAPEVIPEPAAASALEDGPDLDAEARILALIEQGHSASQAGILAGKSDSYGRQVARLKKAARQEPAGDERTEGDAV